MSEDKIVAVVIIGLLCALVGFVPAWHGGKAQGREDATKEHTEQVLATIDEYSKWLSHEFPDAGRALDNLYAQLSGLELNSGSPIFADEPCTISTLRQQMRLNRDRRAALKGASPSEGDA